MKVAVVALTRGYPNNQNLYGDLIKRNQCIYNNFIKIREAPADLILFHEGNITVSDQIYIKDNFPGELIFKDVSKYFKVVDLKLEGEEKFTLGYRQMCRFHMFHIWKEVSEYDYIFRIDEDVELIKCDPYIFEYMNENNINYLTGRFTKETHRLTNNTLPDFLLDNTELDVEKIYNHRNPYTNLYASKVSFWTNNEIQSLLKTIALTDKQIINRWGDHTVQGIILNHKNEKIKLFPNLVYNHISHNLVIKNNFIRNILINSIYNPISTNGNIISKFKLKLKAKLTSKNKFDFENN